MSELIEADDFIEAMAEEMHRIWMAWAEDLINTEKHLSEERLDRWHEFLVDYDKLDEAVKEKDRELADYIFTVLIHTFPRLQEIFVQEEEKEYIFNKMIPEENENNADS